FVGSQLTSNLRSRNQSLPADVFSLLQSQAQGIGGGFQIVFVVVNQISQLAGHIGKALGSQLLAHFVLHLAAGLLEGLALFGLNFVTLENVETVGAFNHARHITFFQGKYSAFQHGRPGAFADPAQFATFTGATLVLGVGTGQVGKAFFIGLGFFSQFASLGLGRFTFGIG